jgi:hypothetical protein
LRIPFPIRIPLSYSFAFAITLCVIQVLEGTPSTYSLMCFAFIAITTLAFNVAGGLARPSGAYIFFYAVLAVVVGLTYKALLGEPADSNLSAPQTTMLVYVAGAFGMLCAAYLKQVILPKKGLLDGLTKRIDLDAASIGCVVVGFAIYFAGVLTVRGGETADEIYANNSGTVLSALGQVNHFIPLGLILGVTYTIKHSGGRRFLNATVAIAAILSIVFSGIIATSKQGLFEPVICIMAASAALRYRFSIAQVAAFMVAMSLAFYYLVPFIQAGKGVVAAPTFAKTAENAYTLLTDLDGARRRTAEAGQEAIEADDYSIHYFNTAQGIFDRLQMISIDDALIDITEQGHVFGLTPLLYDVYNLVPHFIWPDKPLIALGNIYSHEIGMAHYSSQGEDDTTTGISFSPTADAFHMARWMGVLLIAPALWFACFFVMDFICGDTRESPWGLLMFAMCAHIAPEGMMNGPFHLLTFGPMVIIFVTLLSVYVLPVIGNVMKRTHVPVTEVDAGFR